MAQHVGLDERHRVVATCIIHRRLRWWKRTEYLIKERAKIGGSPYPGKWEVVGGGMQPSLDYENRKMDNHDGWENVLARFTIPRETDEEVGLVIGTPRPLGDFVFLRDDGVPVLGMRYVAEYVSGKVVLDEEATESKWIYASEVGDYDLIGTIAEDIKFVDHGLKQWFLRIYDWCMETVRWGFGIRKKEAAYF
ncbi:MAG: NUDIX hydrolase [Minisyncoccia bacterium]